MQDHINYGCCKQKMFNLRSLRVLQLQFSKHHRQFALWELEMNQTVKIKIYRLRGCRYNVIGQYKFVVLPLILLEIVSIAQVPNLISCVKCFTQPAASLLPPNYKPATPTQRQYKSPVPATTFSLVPCFAKTRSAPSLLPATSAFPFPHSQHNGLQ